MWIVKRDRELGEIGIFTEYKPWAGTYGPEERWELRLQFEIECRGTFGDNIYNKNEIMWLTLVTVDAIRQCKWINSWGSDAKSIFWCAFSNLSKD